MNQLSRHTAQQISLPIFVQEQITLHDKNWFATGGKARWYAEPTTALEMSSALQWAAHNELPVFMLGEGANILISDEGFAGLVIRPQITNLEVLQQSCSATAIGHVRAGAGASFGHLIDFCLANNLLGLEEFSGIPGTVGGSVFINIHYFQFLLSNFLVSATIVHKTTGILETVAKDWFNFGYDYSKLHDGDYYLVDATFELRIATSLEAAHAQGRRDEIIRHRRQRYPTARTCGSFFRNFHPHEVTLESAGKKLIFVAYYLDKIGVKGELSVGDAIVSYQHANMIVNKGAATSTDIILLARKMQELVRNQFGITPVPECQLLGFSEYPLLTP